MENQNEPGKDVQEEAPDSATVSAARAMYRRLAMLNIHSPVAMSVQELMLRSEQKMLDPEIIDLYETLIKEEAQEFMDADAVDDRVEKLDAAFDLVWVAVGYIYAVCGHFDTVWEEGAISNLAKVDPLLGKVARRADGKILKPEGWQKPNFAKFLKQRG